MYHSLREPEDKHTCCLKSTFYNKNAQYFKFFGKYWMWIMPQDALRVVVICVILIELQQPKLLWILTPHATILLLVGMIAIGVAAHDSALNTLRIWRNSNQDSFVTIAKVSCCWIWSLLLAPLLFLSGTILMILAFPFTTFHWTWFYASSHYAGRYCQYNNEYINGLLQYVLNNNNNNNNYNIKNRIIVCNYYLMAIFAKEIETMTITQSGIFCNEPKTLINYIAYKHNDNIHNNKYDGLELIKWRDIRNNNNVKDTGGGDLVFFISFCLLLIYNAFMICSLLIAHYNQLSIESIIVIVGFLFIETICFVIDILMCYTWYYCYHLLPFIGNIKQLSWNTKFKNVGEMLENIQIIYEIMFNSAEEIKIIFNNNHIHPNIANIIVEYLWSPIPIYHDDDDEKTEIQCKLNKIILDFKNCQYDIDIDST